MVNEMEFFRSRQRTKFPVWWGIQFSLQFGSIAKQSSCLFWSKSNMSRSWDRWSYFLPAALDAARYIWFPESYLVLSNIVILSLFIDIKFCHYPFCHYNVGNIWLPVYQRYLVENSSHSEWNVIVTNVCNEVKCVTISVEHNNHTT